MMKNGEVDDGDTNDGDDGTVIMLIEASERKRMDSQ
jgi:hypothetical protein